MGSDPSEDCAQSFEPIGFRSVALQKCLSESVPDIRARGCDAEWLTFDSTPTTPNAVERIGFEADLVERLGAHSTNFRKLPFSGSASSVYMTKYTAPHS
jgi:hypothetical protein